MKNKEMVNLINLRRSVALNKKAMAEKISHAGEKKWEWNGLQY